MHVFFIVQALKYVGPVLLELAADVYSRRADDIAREARNVAERYRRDIDGNRDKAWRLRNIANILSR